MFNQFSNEATHLVFEEVVNDPDEFEKVTQLPTADVVPEIRTFIENKIQAEGLAKDLTETALRNVRWAEIRDALKRSA